MSQTPKFPKPDRAALAAKTPGLDLSSSISACSQLQLEQGRESLVTNAQQEKMENISDGDGDEP